MADGEAQSGYPALTPVTPLSGASHHPRRAGFRDGLAAAVILLGLALSAGIVRVGGASPVGSPSPMPSATSPAVTSNPTDGAVVPIVSPALPCASVAPTGQPSVLLRIDGSSRLDGAVVGGSLGTTIPSPVPVPAVDIYSPVLVDLFVAQRQCALAWLVTLDGVRVAYMENPSLDPGLAAQDDIAFPLAAVGDRVAELRAHLVFASGDITFVWHVTIHGLVASGLSLLEAGPDQTPGQGGFATPGCAFTFHLDPEFGNQLASVCGGPEGPAPTLEGELFVQPGSVVAMDDTTFAALADPARPLFACGTIQGDGGFVLLPGCRLGYTASPGFGLAFTLPPDPARLVIAITGCQQNFRYAACGTWYAKVNTIDPLPTPGID